MKLKKEIGARQSAGFTIIETLIVLAIAGMILLIVFQAIPVLGRNSRNSQRRDDVQAVLAAVSHYELNNSGNAFPSSCSTSPAPPDCLDGVLHYAHLSYYDKVTGVSFKPQSSGAGAFGPATSVDVIEVYNYQKCNPASVGRSTSQGAGYNDIVALYTLEGGNSTTTPQCQQL